MFLVAILALTVFVGCNDTKNPAEVKEIGGTLVIYSPNSDSEVENIIPAFEKAYGVTVQLISAGTGECVTRIDAEKANPQADILFGGMNLGVYTQNPELWEKYTSPNEYQIDEAYRQNPETPYFTNYLLSGSGAIILNNKLIEELGLTGQIKSYADLLRPELKGKIASGDPTKSSSAWAEITNMLLVMGDEPYDEKAWQYVTDFVAQLDGIELSSSSAIYKGVADGEYAVGVSYEDPCMKLVQDGAPVTVIYPEEGVVWLPSGSAIVKDAKNMEQAKAFIDFLISEECQTIISKLTVRGTNSKIDIQNPVMKPFSEINVKYEDIPFVAEHKTEWQARYDQIRTDYLANK